MFLEGLETNFFPSRLLGFLDFYLGFKLSATLFTNLDLDLDASFGLSLAGLGQLELLISGLSFISWAVCTYKGSDDKVKIDFS